MSIVELLAELRALDVHVVLDGERLRLNAPAGVLTDAHRGQLQQRKAEILEFLRTAQRLTRQQRAIVPLQASGSHQPVFAVAGHSGDVFCYRALAEHLGAEQPFYGLQPPGLEEGSEPLTDVGALASYYASQIGEFHPSGPCIIAGFCAGGTVAFELAQQLHRAGRNITSLVLFGAPYCTSYRAIPQLIANGSYLARRSVVHARALLSMPSDRHRYFSDRMRALQQPEPAAPTDPVLVRRGLVEEATLAAVRKYQPEAFPGHLDVMLPCESWTQSSDTPLRWIKLSSTCARFVGPEGCNGDNMLLPGHAATFAAYFKQARDNHSRGSRP